MKTRFRMIRRLAAFGAALFLTLQLGGCGWIFMPGPVIITEDPSAEALSSESSLSASTEASLSESSADPGTSAASEASSAPEASSTKEIASADVTASSEDTPTADAPAESTESGEAAESAENAETTATVETTETVETAASAETPETAETCEGGETAESSEAPASFTVDYFRTPAILRDFAAQTALVDAYNLIEACLNYRTSSPAVSAPEDAGLVLYLADTLCPLLKAFTNISEESFSGGTFSWEFYVSKMEFALIRAEFEKQVASYIEPILALSGDYRETERALLLYHAYTAPASYNYDILSGTFKTRTEAEQHRIHSAYAGIVDHKGVCHDLAGGMTFLFIQAGFNAGRVSVITKEDEHSWTLIELDGRYTFVDATWDVGGSFSYFGTSAAGRTTQVGGSFRKDDMNLYRYNAPSHYDIVDPGFKKLHQFSRSYSGTLIDLSIEEGFTPHRLRFTLPDGSHLSIDCP